MNNSYENEPRYLPRMPHRAVEIGQKIDTIEHHESTTSFHRELAGNSKDSPNRCRMLLRSGKLMVSFL